MQTETWRLMGGIKEPDFRQKPVYSELILDRVVLSLSKLEQKTRSAHDDIQSEQWNKTLKTRSP